MNERKMFYGAGKKVFRNAYMLRKSETEAEKLLWERLRKNQIDGRRFKRQHPVAYFIADFYCHKAKLVIELDGKYHDLNEQKLYDENRTEMLSGFGLRVLRFQNDEVIHNIDAVIETIRNCLH